MVDYLVEFPPTRAGAIVVKIRGPAVGYGFPEYRVKSPPIARLQLDRPSLPPENLRQGRFNNNVGRARFSCFGQAAMDAVKCPGHAHGQVSAAHFEQIQCDLEYVEVEYDVHP